MRVLKQSEVEEWNKVLERSLCHDFYHWPGYHSLAEEKGEGVAHLFVHEQDGYQIALPLLLRPLELVAGLESAGAGLWDATSVYGYAGPIASHADIPSAVVHDFQVSLAEALRGMSVVTVFSRLHPLLPGDHLLAGLGECIPCGQTVSIDLTLPPEVQRGKFRRNHVRDIQKLQRQGMVCVEDREWRHFPSFIDIYTETMKRVGAADYYFFDEDYFMELRERLLPNCHLFAVLSENEVACAGLFVVCGGIVQYHLGGTRDRFLKQAPMKLLCDEVRIWCISQGLDVLHLGGGVSGKEDQLFYFKTGFSDCVHKFSTWRWILDGQTYTALCRGKQRIHQPPQGDSVDFFPAYRSKHTPLEAGAFTTENTVRTGENMIRDPVHRHSA